MIIDGMHVPHGPEIIFAQSGGRDLNPKRSKSTQNLLGKVSASHVLQFLRDMSARVSNTNTSNPGFSFQMRPI